MLSSKPRGVGVEHEAPSSDGDEQSGADPRPAGQGDFCTSCGASIAGMRFCGNCGTTAGGGTRRHGDIEVGAVDSGGRVTVSRKGIITVTVIALVVVGLAGTAWAVLGRATERTHTIRGEMTLMDYDSFRRMSAGSSCSGDGGYSDMDEGATVSVKNQSGTLIGSGHLGAGKIEGDVLKACVFPFEVKGVKDAQFFQVEVGRRGGLSYSKADMEQKDWTVSASLGS